MGLSGEELTNLHEVVGKYHLPFNSHDRSVQGMTFLNACRYSSQLISGQCTKAALLIDPRYSETTFAVTMNIMYNLGPGWDLFIYCHQQCDVLKEEFKGLVTLSELTNMYEYEDNCSGLRVVFRELEDLSLHSAHKVS